MKCLEKDRDHRYETANALVRDIQRFLANEVVEARPPSNAYLLLKFYKRNRRNVIAAGLLLLITVLGTIGTTIGLFEANHQKNEAQKKAIENGLLAKSEQQAKLEVL